MTLDSAESFKEADREKRGSTVSIVTRYVNNGIGMMGTTHLLKRFIYVIV